MTSSPKFWMLLPVVLLLGSLSMGITTLVLATNDPAFAVEENYYARSAQVDETLADRAEARALGWKLRTVSRLIDPSLPSQRMRFRVVGPDGESVVGLEGELTAFHNARASQKQTVTLMASADEPGVYEALLRLDRGGWWVWQYELRREDDRARGEARSQLVAASTEARPE